MQQFNVQEAESNLSRLLDMALEGEEVIIARQGTPVATLTPVSTETGDRILGAGRGSVTILDEDWHKPMSDEEADAFWAGTLVNPSHLLDTSTLLWAVHAPEKLSLAARHICSSREMRPAVSVVSLMEMIVKSQKGNLQLTPDPVQWWDRHVSRLGYSVLPVSQDHVECLWRMPLIHKDPADRLLIAQATVEGIPLVTCDLLIGQYPISTIW